MSHLFRLAGIALLGGLPFMAAPSGEALLAAARNGNAAEVERLLKEGAEVDTRTRYATTPLYFAARNGHLDVVKLLLAKGADPNVTDTFYKMHVLAAAAEKGGVPVMKALLEAGAKPPPNLLMMAAIQASPDAVRFLIDATKPTPEALSNILQMALQNKREDNAKVLREAGAALPEVKTVSLPPETLARIAASYSNEQAGVFEFTVKDGKLTGGSGGQSLVFEAIDERTFFPVAAPTARLVFTIENNQATGFTLTNAGQTLVFKRMGTSK
jgi:ankyrin repeat protein